MKVSLRDRMFRIWYWYVNKIDKNADITFMNYGYHNAELPAVALTSDDEKNRYSIQLYHRLASAVGLKDKKILEIGCGRGGGLAFVARQFAPAHATGLDLDQRAANFANQHYPDQNLSFVQGDAQALPFENETFDSVLNVESSHRYQSMPTFLAEVQRVLKPGGYFLFTDFRYDHEMAELEETLKQTNLVQTGHEAINPHVVAALERDTPNRQRLVKKLAPRFLHKTALNFAGAKGSDTFNKIKNREYIYFLYIFRKPA